ncbi:hypothetical protein LTR72_003258 [Exophiala xenobiotica]|nr:hypothetical protein LTR72_003258 [Exophiala xenobiotica]KAK5301016.1 hypothetical protein LTR14_001414 [Exophiala xenobiotica]KAK5489551.1 hypothetical protein LTR55_004070 [Exophiala xenobiotica]
MPRQRRSRDPSEFDPEPEYARLGKNICQSGEPAMAPCPQCTEFDKLEKKKQQLREQCRQGRKMMAVFARQLLHQEQKVSNLEKRLENISRRQGLMLDREARALGELEANAPLPDEPEQQVMGFEDNFFLADDPNLL